MQTPTLTVMDPTAAAIAVGSETRHVSLAGGPPKVFGTVTGQLHALRAYFLAQGVRPVAMEATGIYWRCTTKCWNRPAWRWWSSTAST